MDIGDWITLGAVIVALGVGVASILHTQNLQKKGRREKLLNEIIEWAIKILEVNRGPTVIDTSIPRIDKKSLSFSFEYEMLLRASVNILTWESVYIGCLAEVIDDRSLRQAVENTRLRLRQHIKILDLCRNKKLKDNSAVGRHRDTLDDEARRVIKLAVGLL